MNTHTLLSPADLRSPLFKLLTSNFRDNYVFSPFGGLGDRVAFYALIPEFERVHETSVRVLCFGSVDPLLELFPSLQSRIVVFDNRLIVYPIHLSHWIYGAESPRKGLIYFTWHVQYLGGDFALGWSRSSSEDQNHKNFIRMILGLPESAKPQGIIVNRSGDALRGGKVILAPIANSVGSNIGIFIELARKLTEQNLPFIWNLGNITARSDASLGEKSNLFAEMVLKAFPLADIFQGSLQELLTISCDEKSYTVTSRSGLCELLSLSNANYSIISSIYDAPFWSLHNWGKRPRISLGESYDSLETVLHDLRVILP